MRVPRAGRGVARWGTCTPANWGRERAREWERARLKERERARERKRERPMSASDAPSEGIPPLGGSRSEAESPADRDTKEDLSKRAAKAQGQAAVAAFLVSLPP